jgi:hypothetical protein
MKLKKYLNLGVVATIVLLATMGATRLHHSKTKPLSVTFTAVSQSGQNIPSIFDGLSPNPAYSLKLLEVAEKNARPPCKANNTKQNALERFFEPTSVHAANCPPGLCGGTEWMFQNEDCAGGPCDGFIKHAQPEPNGDPCIGMAPSSGHCGFDCSCGQSDSECYMC